MGACLSSSLPPRAGATPARQLSTNDDEEALRLAVLEGQLKRAAHRNAQLRVKADNAAMNPGAPGSPGASNDPLERDALDRRSAASSATWSVAVEPGSRVPSLPSHPSSASSRHFPGPPDGHSRRRSLS